MSAPTDLLTPLPPGLVENFMIGACAIGLIPATTVAAARWRNPDLRKSVSAVAVWGLAAMFVISSPALAAGALTAAYQYAEVETFGWSAPIYTTAEYRVVSFDRINGRMIRYEAWIAPTSKWASVPINQSDYRKLLTVDEPNRASRYCLRVNEQRAGDAMRIMVEPAGRDTQSKLVPCPTAPNS